MRRIIGEGRGWRYKLRRDQPSVDAKSRQGGFVIAWFALLITALIGLCGVAVDLGNWYLNVQRLQSAADSAALSGGVFLPGDPTGAKNAARATLKANNITTWNTATLTTSGNKLTVAVPADVDNIFLKVLPGFPKKQKFTRSATATHQAGLNLATGRNYMGDPGTLDSSDKRVKWQTGWWGVADPRDGKYWLAVGGHDAFGSPKRHGDRIDSKYCYRSGRPANDDGSPAVAMTAEDGCDGTDNLDYDSKGYSYLVHIEPSSGTGYFFVQIYDPGFSGEDSRNGSTDNPKAYFELTTPSGSVLAKCNYDPDEASYRWVGLDNTCPTSSGPSKGFPVNLSIPQDFVINIHGGSGGGANDFLLQAGIGSTSTSDSVNLTNSRNLVSLKAEKHLVVDNYYDGVGSTFPLTQVPSSWAGRTITFQFFDIGDVVYGAEPIPGRMRLLKDDPANPSNHTSPGGTCRIGTPNKAAPNVSSPSCTLDFDAITFQGQVIGFEWTVPTTWSCAPTSLTRDGGCWIYAETKFQSGARVADTTTWTLDMPGVPLRLEK